MPKRLWRGRQTHARRAPVLGGERPWRWHLAGNEAELYLAGSGNAYDGPDPVRVLIDCGSALHHALVVLRGEGARMRVERFPDPRRPDLLAQVRLHGFGPPTPAEIRALRMVALRPGVSRPGRAAIHASTLVAMESAAAHVGACLRLLDGDPDGPDADRAFIGTNVDPPRGWLTVGEALSAVALTAAEHGLAALPDRGAVLDGRGRAAVPLRLGLPGRRPATRRQ